MQLRQPVQVLGAQLIGLLVLAAMVILLGAGEPVVVLLLFDGAGLLAAGIVVAFPP